MSDKPVPELDAPVVEGPPSGRPPASMVNLALLVLAVFAVLYLAREFFLPVTLAILLYLLLRPAVRALERLHLPAGIGAALILAVVLGVTGFTTVRVWQPAMRWFTTAPQRLARLESQLLVLRRPVEQVTRAAAEVEKMTTVEDEGPPTQKVVLEEPGLMASVLAHAPALVGQAAVTVVLLYFLLSFGDLFLYKLVRVLPTLEDKRRAIEIARSTEYNVSRYLFTITVINTVLAIAVGLAMRLAGMPNPMLWGVMAGVLNFVPYLGAMVGVAVTAFVSLVTFPELGRAAVAPLLYFALTSLEGGFITPIILGRSFRLNPVVIFTAIFFWGWMWGIGGALLAVPMLATFKILSDHIAPLRRVGEFLAR